MNVTVVLRSKWIYSVLSIVPTTQQMVAIVVILGSGSGGGIKLYDNLVEVKH
jgi:hypothetical protein